MTFNPAIPLASDSPAIFPAQSQVNYSRLQTIVAADHQFNLTAAANDGYHNIIHMTQQSPSGALAATGRSYAKVSGGQVNQFYMDDAGTEYQITPTMPIRAAVSFNGFTAGVIPPESAYNITTVTQTSTATYQIVWTTPFADDKYIIQVTGLTGSFYIAGYVTQILTTSITIRFVGGLSAAAPTLLQPVRAFVTVFSTT